MIGGLDDAMDGDLPLGELSRIASRYSTLAEFTIFLRQSIARAATLGADTLDSPRVRLITYFRSKGQQFGTVILPTLNAGQIPHHRSPEEDERRLFYVGVTRATENLWLSYVDEICGHPARPSSFLRELQLPEAAFMTAPAARVRAPELIHPSGPGFAIGALPFDAQDDTGWLARNQHERNRPAHESFRYSPECDFRTRYLEALRDRRSVDD